MTIVTADIPYILIERIEGSHPKPALFSACETEEWPTKVLDGLLNCGVLQLANRAESAWCPGCEWQCHKTVVVRTRRGCPQTDAHIICNEEPDLGRIPVPTRHLVRYGTTLSAVSSFIAGQMALGDPRPSAAGASFLLGTIRGRHGPCQMALGLDAGRLLLRMRGEEEPLVQVLLWDGISLSIDRGLVRRLANRKGAASPTRTSRPPDRSMRRNRVRSTRARHSAIFAEAKKRRAADGGSWTAVAAAIAQSNLAVAENGHTLAAASIRRIVSEMSRRERESFRSNRSKGFNSGF